MNKVRSFRLIGALIIVAAAIGFGCSKSDPANDENAKVNAQKTMPTASGPGGGGPDATPGGGGGPGAGPSQGKGQAGAGVHE